MVTLQIILILVVFAFFVFMMIRNKIPALIALPLMGIAFTLVGGLPFSEIAKVGDVVDDAWQFHAFTEVVDGSYLAVEGKVADSATRVTSRFFQLLHDVVQGGHAD